MITVILVIHLMIAAALVAVVLLQRSEGGALGIGGGGGGFLSGRGTANLLTRTTAILAGAFFVTSMLLTILAKQHAAPGSVFDRLDDAPGTSAPAVPRGSDRGLPNLQTPAAPEPVAPSVPQSK